MQHDDRRVVRLGRARLEDKRRRQALRMFGAGGLRAHPPRRERSKGYGRNKGIGLLARLAMRRLDAQIELVQRPVDLDLV